MPHILLPYIHCMKSLFTLKCCFRLLAAFMLLELSCCIWLGSRNVFINLKWYRYFLEYLRLKFMWINGGSEQLDWIRVQNERTYLFLVSCITFSEFTEKYHRLSQQCSLTISRKCNQTHRIFKLYLFLQISSKHKEALCSDNIAQYSNYPKYATLLFQYLSAIHNYFVIL